MNIAIKNTLTEQQGLQQTYLAGTVTAGGTTAGVKNIAGFTNQWAAQIGQTGEEQSEILIISGVPSGTTFNFGTAPSNTAGTFLYPHAPDTPIYNIHYDQIVVNRSTAGTAGPFSALGTYNIQPDNEYTNINDATGASTYAYYVQYYNSVSGDLSGSSSVFVPGGPTFYSLQAIRSRIKGKLYSSGFIRNDSDVNDWINECYEEMVNSAIKVNENYMMGSATIGFGTNGLGTITDSSYKNLIKLEVSWDNVNFLTSQQMNFADFREIDYFDMYHPQHTWRGETVFEVLPHRQGGTVNAYYSTRFTPLVNDTDELTQTLKAYSRAFVEYGLAQAYGVDQQADFDKHMGMFDKIKADFISEITPRDFSSIKMIQVLDNPSALQEDIWNDFGEIW